MRLKLHRKHSTPMFGGKFSIFASIMNVFAASSRFNKIYYKILHNIYKFCTLNKHEHKKEKKPVSVFIL